MESDPMRTWTWAQKEKERWFLHTDLPSRVIQIDRMVYVISIFKMITFMCFQSRISIFFVKRLLQGVHSQPFYPSKPNSLGASSTVSTWRTGGPWAADLETHRVRRVGSSPRACTHDRAQGAVSLPQFPQLKPGSVANTPTSRPSTEAR